MNDVRPDSVQTLHLLDQASAGDDRAIGQLLERYLPRVEAAVQCRIDPRVRARLDVVDVVQETQVEALRRLPEYLAARPMPFHLWIMRATHQQLSKAVRHHLQTAKRAVDREVPLPDRTSLCLVRGLAATNRSPASSAVCRELARSVRRVLARLGELDREIIELRNFESFSNGEAACILGISPDAAKKRYTRALVRLQELMRAEGILEYEP